MNSLEPLRKLADAHKRLAGIYEGACEQAEPILQEIAELDDSVGVVASTKASVSAKPTKKVASKKAPSTNGRKRPKNDITLPELIMKILSDKECVKQGLKLKEIVQKVMGAGYQTSSKKAQGAKPEDGYTQLVYQAIKKLRDKEPKAWVEKNEDSRRYYLTPEGKKAA